MTPTALRRLLAVLALALTTTACGSGPETEGQGEGSSPTATAGAAASPDAAGTSAAAGGTSAPQDTPDPTVVALVQGFKPPEKGDAGALISIYEFSDYICPYCRSFNEEVSGKIDADYVQTGKARYVHWDFPLAGHGYGAIVSAEASHCAGEQGKYWEMHKALFGAWEQQSKLDVKDEQAAITSALAIGGQVDLDQAAFKACVEAKKYRPVVATMYRQATDMGLDATPAFVIQHKDPANPTGPDKIKVVLGALAYEDFAQTLDIEIARAQGTPIPDTPTPTADPAATATAAALLKTATASAPKP